jgi:hypothetical protein
LLRIKSSDKDLAKEIISEINSKLKIIFGNPKFNDQIKLEASKLILRIVQFYKDELESESELVKCLTANLLG